MERIEMDAVRIPGRAKGKWIAKWRTSTGGCLYKCSECGTQVTVEDGDVMDFEYCPYCGSDMEEADG